MLPSIINRLNHVMVPLFKLDQQGHVMPNTIFHRPIDKLHSRCIEYPFAASQVGNAQCILDVGTIKSDPIWISWLENLPIEVHATDYDEPVVPFTHVKFHHADIRKLPLPDSTFDKVIAVSVIEHIGLKSPQVLASKIPNVSEEGDFEAVRELARVLKPGGELVMTVPFGLKDELILGHQARCYTMESIKKFERALQLTHIEYYEYQQKNSVSEITYISDRPNVLRNLYNILAAPVKAVLFNTNDADHPPGEVTWKHIPPEKTRACHRTHVDGVACGVWKKNNR